MLVQDRPTLFADEPTLGLDRRATIATIAAFHAEAARGRAIVVSSHDLRTVASLAHRAIVLAEGRVIADGPVFEVLRDAPVLDRAGLVLPPLLRWLLDEVPSSEGVRRALDALDAAVSVPGRAS